MTLFYKGSFVTLLLCAAAGMTACGSDSTGDNNQSPVYVDGGPCTDGAQASCECSTGQPGTATCYGSLWGSCFCNGSGTGGGSSGPGSCGNGVVEGAEMCDGVNLKGETCATATMGARPSGTLSCSPTCTFVTTACTGGPSGNGGSSGNGGTSGGGTFNGGGTGP